MTATDLRYIAPNKLEVLHDAPVHRVLFDSDGKIVGVATTDGRTLIASKEVIICGGCHGLAEELVALRHRSCRATEQVRHSGHPRDDEGDALAAVLENNVAFLEEPKSDRDEDILEQHMSSTCRPSEKQDKAVVDTGLYGVEGLRVADMSVMPMLPSTHTQACAYQFSMIAAERLIAEYGL